MQTAWFISNLFNTWKNSRMMLGKKLIKVTHDCVGCGLCTKVCPSGSMQMEKGKAVHISEKCQTCLACIHNCPHKVLAMDIPEKNLSARYRNEHIRLEEIIEANNQNAGEK